MPARNEVPGVLLVGASLLGLALMASVVADFFLWKADASLPLSTGAIALNAYFLLAGVTLLLSSLSLVRGSHALEPLQIALFSVVIVAGAGTVYHLVCLVQYLAGAHSWMIFILVAALAIEGTVAVSAWVLWRRFRGLINRSRCGTSGREA